MDVAMVQEVVAPGLLERPGALLDQAGPELFGHILAFIIAVAEVV